MEYNEDLAMTQGWLLVNNDVHGLRIEKYDAAGMFDTDEAALDEVMFYAEQGDEHAEFCLTCVHAWHADRKDGETRKTDPAVIAADSMSKSELLESVKEAEKLNEPIEISGIEPIEGITFHKFTPEMIKTMDSPAVPAPIELYPGIARLPRAEFRYRARATNPTWINVEQVEVTIADTDSQVCALSLRPEGIGAGGTALLNDEQLKDLITVLIDFYERMPSKQL